MGPVDEGLLLEAGSELGKRFLGEQTSVTPLEGEEMDKQ